jgi:putative oxidoreductase
MLNRLSAQAPLMLGLLRIVAGLLFMEHGTQKLLGFPAGPNPMPPAGSFMWFGGIVEAACGLLIALGLFTRIAAFIAAGEMAVAYWMFHAPSAFYPAVNGGDAAVLFCFVFLYLVFAGPGALSLDGTRRIPSGYRRG